MDKTASGMLEDETVKLNIMNVFRHCEIPSEENEFPGVLRARPISFSFLLSTGPFPANHVHRKQN